MTSSLDAVGPITAVSTVSPRNQTEAEHVRNASTQKVRSSEPYNLGRIKDISAGTKSISCTAHNSQRSAKLPSFYRQPNPYNAFFQPLKAHEIPRRRHRALRGRKHPDPRGAPQRRQPDPLPQPRPRAFRLRNMPGRDPRVLPEDHHRRSPCSPSRAPHTAPARARSAFTPRRWQQRARRPSPRTRSPRGHLAAAATAAAVEGAGSPLRSIRSRPCGARIAGRPVPPQDGERLDRSRGRRGECREAAAVVIDMGKRSRGGERRRTGPRSSRAWTAPEGSTSG